MNSSMGSVSYEQEDHLYRQEKAHSQSQVKHILKSPAHYQAAIKQRFLPTLRMQMGSAAHCLLLEGEDQFNKDFICKPPGLNLATTKGKEWKEENKGKTVLSTSDQYCSWDAVHGMVDSLRRLEWFNPSQPDYRKFNEVSLYWDPGGLPCKARLDRLLLTPDEAVVLDVKTTDSIEPSVFLKKLTGDLNYLFQSGWYTDGTMSCFMRPTSFVFVAVEVAPPHLVGVFEITAAMVEEASLQVQEARRLLKRCEQKKQWPEPCVAFTTLDLPPWYISPVQPDLIDRDAAIIESIFDLP